MDQINLNQGPEDYVKKQQARKLSVQVKKFSRKKSSFLGKEDISGRVKGLEHETVLQGPTLLRMKEFVSFPRSLNS